MRNNQKPNTMKTPVEFLLEKYNYITRLRKRDEISQVEADEAIARYLQHIKEMEKHYIINAYQQGAINHTDKVIDVMKESQDYYDLVFNNTKTKTL
jgi:bifunctional ADP-heptose synthase (sugar kinase/adenylyltransferase)